MPAVLAHLHAHAPSSFLLRKFIQSLERVSDEDEPLTKLAIGWGQFGAFAAIVVLGAIVAALCLQAARAEMRGLVAAGGATKLIARLLLLDAGALSALVAATAMMGAEPTTLGALIIMHALPVATTTAMALISLRRSGPLRLNGMTAVIGGLGSVTALLSWNAVPHQVVPMLYLPLSIGAILFAYSLRSIYVREQHAFASKDARPNVLYLRAFAYEYVCCLHPIRGPVPFDDFIGDEVREQIGPFMALGNPMDAIAARGASRKYASDQDWQREFAQALARSAVIIVVPGPSANLAWELDAILAAGLETRLFVVSPPLLPIATAPVSRSDRVALWVAERMGIPRVSEPRVTLADERDFIALLRGRGFKNLPDPAPDGSVLAFNEDRSAVFLTQGQFEPSGFAWAIKCRLQSLPPLSPVQSLELESTVARRGFWYWAAHTYEDGVVKLAQRMPRPLQGYARSVVWVIAVVFISQVFPYCAWHSRSERPAPASSAARFQDSFSD